FEPLGLRAPLSRSLPPRGASEPDAGAVRSELAPSRPPPPPQRPEVVEVPKSATFNVSPAEGGSPELEWDAAGGATSKGGAEPSGRAPRTHPRRRETGSGLALLVAVRGSVTVRVPDERPALRTSLFYLACLQLHRFGVTGVALVEQLFRVLAAAPCVVSHRE